ncbi:SDR family NAD(P)-dependent oxidoreductase [Streptomyces polychromogenes]|uniref:SDR family NAD(P)-dependent oxidoreductase n=1 Tax=Streptomyces polychromogenes TaxID=67342 RepID=A0ABN0VGA2_9ACTN
MSARTALVTGANRGLGLAVSRHLLAAGHTVVTAARTHAAAEETARLLGPGARAAVLDVTDEDSVRAARRHIGPVDVLVNNAGVLLDDGTPPDRVPVDRLADTLAVNTLGALRVTQAFLPAMLERGWGRVVMLSSGTGAFSHGLNAATPAYSVSKAALNAVTVLLATATRDRGVLVNAVNPGRVRTRMMPGATTTPDEAAADIAWAATLPDSGPTGAFLRARRPVDW